jgi:hypothetical protein
MKKILSVTMIVLFCLSSFPAFSQQLTPKPKGQDEWEVHDENGAVAATFERTEKGSYKLYSPDGKYVGLILSSEKFRPPDANEKHTLISPEAAQLYLRVLRVIRRLPH